MLMAEDVGIVTNSSQRSTWHQGIRDPQDKLGKYCLENAKRFSQRLHLPSFLFSQRKYFVFLDFSNHALMTQEQWALGMPALLCVCIIRSLVVED